MIYGPYKATVVGIHDGDTIKLEVDLASLVPMPIDLGFGIQVAPSAKIVVSCRLYGINAPELRTQLGKDALAYMETLVAIGDPVFVASYGWDKYGGRFDGTVSTPGGLSLNKAMVDSGHAVAI